MARIPKISIIVTTYNWPEALKIVLQSFNRQDTNDFEVIVADDGSTKQTFQVIADFIRIAGYPLKHVWHEDKGFRAAMIRNKAAAIAKGDYLIFLDGDCIPLSTFISRHNYLSENGWFVAGNRILLNDRFTYRAIQNNIELNQQPFFYWCKQRIAGHCNRLLPLLYLPHQGLRKRRKQRWQGVKTCNLAIWREDFLQVNGLDESYHGWGYEDSDLVIRLIRNGVYSKSGRFAVPVFHLWHNENDRSRQQENLQLLHKIINSDNIYAVMGVNQYLNS